MVTWLHVYHLIFFKFIYWCTWSHVTIDNYWFFTLILLVFGRRVLDKLGCFKKSKYIEISFSFQLTASLLSRGIIIHIVSIFVSRWFDAGPGGGHLPLRHLPPPRHEGEGRWRRPKTINISLSQKKKQIIGLIFLWTILTNCFKILTLN